MSLATDCEVLPAHVVQLCNDYRKGGISALALISPNAAIYDFTSPNDWNTAITAGDVVIIKNIKASFPKAKALEGENVVSCGSEKMLDGFDGTVSWKDFNVNVDNDSFYGVLGQKQNWHLALYNCTSNEIRVIDQPCTFIPLWAIVPEGQKDKQVYDVSAHWFAPNGWWPGLYAAPVGIFN